MVTICTYNARTLASESSVEDVLMQARRIKYDVTGMSETRRCHPFNTVYYTGEKLFLGTCETIEVSAASAFWSARICP
ncbi:unnamed protein product [Angiostrongylus costaricensis]|uniref:Endo/exonuclease/phosphatase domain-containing protein n=1 Tax=Angiostrongylus costaricensis TaxID=334426 RepID=A0A0R3Q0R4_ANGCS|nr:unnamed protein product [Angiostrongylus costaricensis]